jgi:two-component system, chemotaxis family, protein-glutamate methylesterase/glutaminase
MPAQDIIVVGGSAGGLEAMSKVLSGLPGDLKASLFVVLHTSPQSGTALPQILARKSQLAVAFAVNGEAPRPGHVYVAPPDHHLTLVKDNLVVNRGPRENGFRPAIDPLFRSAAKQYGGRVVGVVLSGALDDGTFGLIAIKEAGGAAIVQHPYEAFVPSMPLSAIQNVEVDHIVPADEIPALVVRAAESGLRSRVSARSTSHGKTDIDPTHRDINLACTPPDELPEPPSTFVCPECGGSLWEVDEAGLKRYRCFTGHGFTADSLLSAQNGKLEEALWSAVRVLMERAALHREMSHRTARRGMKSAADKYQERAQHEENNAHTIREMLSAHSIATEAMAAAGDDDN